MKLLNLHISGFGKFQNVDVSFSDGLNVVYGKNEAGKSTLHTFIRSMLFGMEKPRGKAGDDLYSKYEPWAGSSYGGWLRLESQGEIYRIQRHFQKKNPVLTIFNETLGRQVEPTNALLDQLRCGLTETAYNNTISIGQLKCATDGGMVSELRNYIANLNTSGSIALNITKASAYLKNQRRELESQLEPQAALSYTTVLGEIRKLEQEVSSPAYANQLASFRSKKSQIRQDLEKKQQEKEALLEKSVRGRQVLTGSQFTDRDSITAYAQEARKLYSNYQSALAACGRKGPKIWSWFCLMAALLCFAGTGLLYQMPQVMAYLPLSLSLPVAMAGTGGAGVVFLVLSLLQFGRSKSFRRELDASTRLLQEIFSRHLGDSSVSQDAMDAFEQRMNEFLRLWEAVSQSDAALQNLSQEIAQLQQQEEGYSDHIEQQQHIQWELEKKLEHLADCKTQAESLKRILAENERIKTELEAIDLAQETMTSLSTSIRDSFGLYLNKTASQLISGITGGIYSSMSIDENLNVFMNTPSRLVPIERVSSGTMDQIYLAVRLAAAKLVQNGKDTMPLIFDDSFVLYDDDRLKTALKWLVKAYQSQIIIFTCHQREAQMLTANQIPYHLVRI